MFEYARALTPPSFCGHPVTTNIQFVLAHFFLMMYLPLVAGGRIA